MNNDWYKFDFVTNNPNKKECISDFKRIIDKLFQDPMFYNDIMIFSPKEENVKFTTIWIIPPKTANIPMIEKKLILCGATKCPQPDIDEVSVFQGEEQNIHYFFSNEE